MLNSLVTTIQMISLEARSLIQSRNDLQQDIQRNFANVILQESSYINDLAVERTQDIQTIAGMMATPSKYETDLKASEAIKDTARLQYQVKTLHQPAWVIPDCHAGLQKN